MELIQVVAESCRASSRAGINMSCVLNYNNIAKEVAAEVGGIVINDLWAYVEDFCKHFPQANATFAGAPCVAVIPPGPMFNNITSPRQ